MLEVSIPCRVTIDATGKWQVKPPAGVVGFPTAGIDVGIGATKGVTAGEHSVLNTDGTIVKLGADAFWSSVALYGCLSVILSTLDDGIKYTFGSSGALNLRATEAYVDIYAQDSISIGGFGLSSGAKIIGCHVRVDEALAAGDEWDAMYYWSTTERQNIATNQAVSINTKVKKFFDPYIESPIITDSLFIRLKRNAGGNFTAQGRIRVIVSYEELIQMDDI